MNFLIVGASGGLGRALCERFASAGHDLVTISSDERDLAAMSADLQIRYGARVTAIPADVATGHEYLDDVVRVTEEQGPLDGMLFPTGVVASEDTGGLEPARWTADTDELHKRRRRCRPASAGHEGSWAGCRGRVR